MAGCSKCGEKFCACNVGDTLSISQTGDGSSASPWLFDARIDSNATNLLSVGSNGLLTKFYGQDGANSTFSGSGTLADPAIWDVESLSAIIDIDDSLSETAGVYGVSSNYIKFVERTTGYAFSQSGTAPAVNSVTNIPATAVINVSNPSSTKNMEFLITFEQITSIGNTVNDTAINAVHYTEVKVNGGSWTPLLGTNKNQHFPPATTVGIGVWRDDAQKNREWLATAPAGGNLTLQFQGRITVGGKKGGPLISWDHILNFSAVGRLI
jgi:hypothetical protein